MDIKVLETPYMYAERHPVYLSIILDEEDMDFAEEIMEEWCSFVTPKKTWKTK